MNPKAGIWRSFDLDLLNFATFPVLLARLPDLTILDVGFNDVIDLIWVKTCGAGTGAFEHLDLETNFLFYIFFWFDFIFLYDLVSDLGIAFFANLFCLLPWVLCIFIC